MKTKKEQNAEAVSKKPDELTDDKIGNVTGGSVKLGGEGARMVCSNCGKKGYKASSWIGKTTDCPQCGEHAYTGVEGC